MKANELIPVIPIVDWRSLSELISCCYSQPRILVALHLINNRLANRDLIRRLLGEESVIHSGIGPPREAEQGVLWISEMPYDLILLDI